MMETWRGDVSYAYGVVQVKLIKSCESSLDKTDQTFRCAASTLFAEK